MENGTETKECMKIGSYEVSAPLLGTFRLDGGAMFGSVPKNLWSKRIPADSENCIPLAARCLYLVGADRKILVDLGMGEKWSDKERTIFEIKNTPEHNLPFKKAEITDIILTHLHFDHAGGISRFTADGSIALEYPQARVYLQKTNLANAQNASVKERASYRKENYDAIAQSQHTLLDGNVEVLPGIRVHRVNGHTIGQQIVEIYDQTTQLFFLTDLMPTSHHVPLPYHLGYDACATTAITEKERFLNLVSDNNSIVVFQHDRDVAAARIVKKGAQHFERGAEVTL